MLLLGVAAAAAELTPAPPTLLHQLSSPLAAQSNSISPSTHLALTLHKTNLSLLIDITLASQLNYA